MQKIKTILIISLLLSVSVCGIMTGKPVPIDDIQVPQPPSPPTPPTPASPNFISPTSPSPPNPKIESKTEPLANTSTASTLPIPSLIGLYKLSIPRAYILHDIGNAMVLYGGCNQYTIPYKKNDKGDIVFGRGFPTTQNQCAVDYDGYYLDVIGGARKIRARDGLKYSLNKQLLDSTGNILLILQQIILNSLDIKYHISFPTLKAAITTNTIIFQGCQLHVLNYVIQKEGFIKIWNGESPIAGGLCGKYPYDGYIVGMMLGVRGYGVTEWAVSLRAGNDEIYLQRDPLPLLQPTNTTLSGTPATPAWKLKGSYSLIVSNSISQTRRILRAHKTFWTVSGTCNTQILKISQSPLDANTGITIQPAEISNYEDCDLMSQVEERKVVELLRTVVKLQKGKDKEGKGQGRIGLVDGKGKEVFYLEAGSLCG